MFVLLGTIAYCTSPARAGEQEWSVDVSGCQAGTVTIWVTYPDNPPIPIPVEVSAHPNDAAGKAREIADFLRGDPPDRPGPLSGFNPSASGGTLSLTCDDRISLRFDVGTTAETDSLKCERAGSGRMTFEGPFAPLSSGGQPAIFTAGIVTDVGELTVSVSAQELNFHTDGPIICQALFQRLAPRAPLYGAAINFAGDRLEVYFDPAYAISVGGVTFGTTSPSPGASGSVTPIPSPPCDGDVDGDGQVTLTDVALVLSAYGSRTGDPEFLPGADLDGDGEVGLGDLAVVLANYGRQC